MILATEVGLLEIMEYGKLKTRNPVIGSLQKGILPYRHLNMAITKYLA